LTSKTTLRAGYGIFFGTLGVNGADPQQYGFSQATPIQPSLDTGQTYRALISNPFPDGLLAPPGRAGGLTAYLSQAITIENAKRLQPYSQRWSIGVQHVLPSQILVEASYVGNRATRLSITRQLNATPAQYLSRTPFRDNTVNSSMTASFP